MYWNLSPYIGNDDLDDYPWILDLMKQYNSLLECLDSQGVAHTYEYITF